MQEFGLGQVKNNDSIQKQSAAFVAAEVGNKKPLLGPSSQSSQACLTRPGLRIRVHVAGSGCLVSGLAESESGWLRFRFVILRAAEVHLVCRERRVSGSAGRSLTL